MYILSYRRLIKSKILPRAITFFCHLLNTALITAISDDILRQTYNTSDFYKYFAVWTVIENRFSNLRTWQSRVLNTTGTKQVAVCLLVWLGIRGLNQNRVSNADATMISIKMTVERRISRTLRSKTYSSRRTRKTLTSLIIARRRGMYR